MKTVTIQYRVVEICTVTFDAPDDIAELATHQPREALEWAWQQKSEPSEHLVNRDITDVDLFNGNHNDLFTID